MNRVDAEAVRLYRAALRLVRDGELERASSTLERFVSQNPKHPYADNAVYWIGEVHYMKREYGKALAAFERVVRDYGDGNRVPDALLKKALCYDRLGDSAKARSTRRLLQSRYPDSAAARSLAKDGAS